MFRPTVIVNGFRQGWILQAPTAELLAETVNGLPSTCSIIFDNPGENYLQSRREGFDSWTVEYREGDAQNHYQALDVPTALVREVMLAYWKGIQFKHLLGWNRIQLD